MNLPAASERESLIQLYLEENLPDSEARRLLELTLQDSTIPQTILAEIESEISLREHYRRHGPIRSRARLQRWALAASVLLAAIAMALLWRASPGPQIQRGAPGTITASFQTRGFPEGFGKRGDTESVSLELATLQTPVNRGDNYTTKITGWLIPPATGAYRFWVSADDRAEVFLSADERPANGRKILELNRWTPPHEWDRYPEQRSALIQLRAGKFYYFEIVHEETVAGDHLQIAWEGPNQPRAIIAGQALAPARSTSPTR